MHSEFSLLDGAARIDAMFERAAELQMPALALTDHGAMFGALQFYEAGVAAGVKPIIGVETYVAPTSRFERAPGESEEKYRHLTILVRNETGYRNLLKLVTDAHLEGFYHRPRIDKELLAEHAEGLIGLSGCLASEISQLLLAGQTAKADDVAGTYAGHLRRGELLRGAPGPRPVRTAGDHAEVGRARELDRPAARGDQRPALHAPRRREATRRPAVHPAAEAAVRHQPAAVRLRTSST